MEHHYLSRNGVPMTFSTRRPDRSRTMRSRRAASVAQKNAVQAAGVLSPVPAPLWLMASQKPAAPCDLCKTSEHLTTHHLIPRSLGGGSVAMLCAPCHEQIHRMWTLPQLAESYHSLAALRAAFPWVVFGLQVRGIPVYGFPELVAGLGPTPPAGTPSSPQGLPSSPEGTPPCP